MDSKDSIYREPKVTTSILASIPYCLHDMLEESVQRTAERRKPILVSSNNLANRFILERWGIRSSQRRRFKNLFSIIRRQCRAIFRNYLAVEKVVWKTQNVEYVFGVFKYDDVRGNLIFGFVQLRDYLKRGYIPDEF